MHDEHRRAYNAAFNGSFYDRFLARLSERVGAPIPFRVAETPMFFTPQLRERLIKAAREVAALAVRPELRAHHRSAVPEKYDVGGMDDLPNCLQVDFAVVRGEDGELDGRVVELQAFPSLYALMSYQAELMGEMLRELPGLDRPWSMYFSDYSQDSYVERLRRAILAGEAPENVVLVDIDPPKQKTLPDFTATKKLFGVDAVCVSDLEKEGRRLFRKKDGRRIEVRRIYNRLVFDEVMRFEKPLGFSFRDELDVSWMSHPNWYWAISKHTMPLLDHPNVPKTRSLAQLENIPDDLERYVLKPLFSFAGGGVKLDITRADIDEIPEEQRGGYQLQEKVVYEPALPMPKGEGMVKAEVRMMFLRGPKDAELELVMNLVRLSRGKMLGVDHNKDMTWVGGSVGLWAEP